MVAFKKTSTLLVSLFALLSSEISAEPFKIVNFITNNINQKIDKNKNINNNHNNNYINNINYNKNSEILNNDHNYYNMDSVDFDEINNDNYYILKTSNDNKTSLFSSNNVTKNSINNKINKTHKNEPSLETLNENSSDNQLNYYNFYNHYNQYKETVATNTNKDNTSNKTKHYSHNNHHNQTHHRNNNKVDEHARKHNSPFYKIIKDQRKAKREITRLNTIKPDANPSMLIERLLENYIKTDAPSITHKNATEVKLGVFVISVYSVNEQTMDYSISMYLRQSWNDPRLSFAKYNMSYETLRMGDGSWNKIWIPDTFLRNEKGASFHSVTVENRVMQLSSDGRVWYVIKITATLSCLMTLEKFPMDTQVCPIAFESFGYQSNTMFFNNMSKMIDHQGKLQLPQFTLVKSTHLDCSQHYTTGSYSCLQINFFLKRDLGYFLIQVYVPSVLIVILSWVSFWINVDASPARVSIGLLTVLTTTTMSSAARSTLPRVSYIKAIDVWMIVCLVFVFTSLIEFAVVNVLSRKVTKPKRPMSQHPGPILKRNPPNSCVAVQQAQRIKPNFFLKFCKPKAKGAPEPDGKMRARAVDKLSRKIFPLTFTVFNFIYWIYYFQKREKNDKL